MSSSDERRLTRLVDQASRGLDSLAALILFLLMVLTCSDVVGRYFFNAPIFGATEMTRLMMGVLIFLALPVIFRREDHIAVDLLDGLFQRRLVEIRQIVINGVTSVLLFGLAQRMWVLTNRAQEYGDMTEYLNIPLWPISGFMTGMIVLSALVTTTLTLAYVLRLFSPRVPTGV